MRRTGFDYPVVHHDSVAHWPERLLVKQRAEGSIPFRVARSYGSVAERLPFKQLKVGPIPTGITRVGYRPTSLHRRKNWARYPGAMRE